MSLKCNDLICKICKIFVRDPVQLPCLCLVCSDHILAKSTTIKCLNCNEEFLTSNHFKPNELAKQVIEKNFHLGDEQKILKKSLDKMISDWNQLQDEFQSTHSNFEIDIHKHFSEIRFKIDLQREELKEEIDKIALKMIDQTKEREKSLIMIFKQSYSQITSAEYENASKILLEKFRLPDMIIENVKESIKKQEVELFELNKKIKFFKLRASEIKEFYFTPNLATNEKTFGFLNIIHKMVSCSDDETIKVWDLETFECTQTIKGGRFTRLEKVTTNKILSGSTDNLIKLWDLNTGTCIKTFDNRADINCLKLISENTFASDSGGVIKIWKIDEGCCIKTLNDHYSSTWDMILLPDGSLASCSSEKTIRIWNVDQGLCTKILNGHIKSVNCLLLLNNKYLVSGSADKTIKIWNLNNDNCIFTLHGHNHTILCLELNQNGQLISGSRDETIKIWDLENGTCIKTLVGHTNQISNIRPYQENLLISSSTDKTIRVWNLCNGECVKTLKAHNSHVSNLIFI